VLDLDDVAAAGQWERRLLPAVYRMIRPAGHVISAPLGMHRTNTLLYNRDVLARVKVSPPRTWDEFERIAPQLLRAGIMPLAQSSEPWQVAILFENLLLADRGLDLHRRLFARHDVHAFADPGLGAVLLHLRRLKRWMRSPVPETAWGAVAGEVARGAAAMVVSGDWIKGELLEAGSRTGRAVGCMAAPGTENMHVYDLDTLVMLRSDRVPRAVQARIAQITVEAPLQERYNRVKGSVPVLRNVDPATLDACARASWTMLADPAATLVPSLAIGMIADEAMRDALVAEIHRFFMDDSVTVQDTQRRLATISRAFFQIPTP
jgi:glucose/mannose transport system substrate-binding protein